MPETPHKEPTVIQMLLDELKAQRADIKEIREDIGELKGDVKLVQTSQADMAQRLAKLEARPAFEIDRKTMITIAATLAAAIIGASRGIPESVWKALLGLLAG